jgi:hypothetical protein
MQVGIIIEMNRNHSVVAEAESPAAKLSSIFETAFHIVKRRFPVNPPARDLVQENSAGSSRHGGGFQCVDFYLHSFFSYLIP